MKTKLLLTAFLITLVASVTAQIIHVPGDQLTIQDGINAANNGDTVLVAENTYFENINFKGKAITLASNFILDGDTTHINNTIIDGSQPSDPDSASVVSFISGENTTSIICGFTITGGNGLIFPSAATRAGGGIICWNSGAKIINNKIIGNEVSFQSNAIGGGIAASHSGGFFLIVIENNVIKNNSVAAVDFGAVGGGLYLEMNAQVNNNIIEQNNCGGELLNALGGGIYCLSEEGFMNDFEFMNNKINNNHVSGPSVYGGGVYALWSALSMSGNEINNNSLSGDKAWGGGLFIRSAGDIDLSENEISNNSIEVNEFCVGCGIYIIYPAANTEIIKNVISDNTGTGNSRGGGIYIGYSLNNQVILDANIFSNNISVSGGGLYTRDVLNCKFTNNVLSFNIANGSGGAIFLKESSNEDGAIHSSKSNLENKTDTTHFVMANNTFSNNSAASYGGAVCCDYIVETINIFNSIFWENEGATGPDVHHAGFNEMNISYSNIDTESIDGPWTGSENINEDPLFVDLEFHIDENSICAGAGTDSLEVNETMFYCPLFDFEDDPRPMPFTYSPDMGADEVDETTEIPVVELPNSDFQLTNYPNPFSNQTIIEFSTLKSSYVKLSVIDFTGKEIQILVSERIIAGTQEFVWNAEGLPAGIYFLRLETNGTTETKKIIVMK